MQLIAAALTIGADYVVRAQGYSPTPVVLVALGPALPAVPRVPAVELDPDLMLSWLLPPLLHTSALRLSLIDPRRHSAAIALCVSVP